MSDPKPTEEAMRAALERVWDRLSNACAPCSYGFVQDGTEECARTDGCADRDEQIGWVLEATHLRLLLAVEEQSRLFASQGHRSWCLLSKDTHRRRAECSCGAVQLQDAFAALDEARKP